MYPAEDEQYVGFRAGGSRGLQGPEEGRWEDGDSDSDIDLP